ncbi:MAG: DUF4349 domain-containing protein [Lachnospiraceae bacterium]|nr:DUF4349 domain-containing protein [Clostridiales bacterium]MBR6848909.1 DUF4349 domain-containing protein [Lachnospiraceae bacterium]
MKKKLVSSILAAFMITAMLSGCSSKAADTTRANKSVSMANAVAGDRSYLAEQTTFAADKEYFYEEENADDIDFAYETTAAMPAGNTPTESDSSAPVSETAGNADTKVDISKEMLVYRCSMAMDTTDFEKALSLLKAKISEYHGFIEKENQTDGSFSSGRYLIEEDEKDYYYYATIRIPSAYYESFVSSTEGIGILRSKNSSVDNVSTRYGTLKNELEIYEAEYQRYLKQYEETQDEKIALQVQSELRRMALTISDLKTEMSMLESDVAYSYVSVTIHKVTQRQLDEEKKRKEEEQKRLEEEQKRLEEEQKKKEEEEKFSNRVSNAAKESWEEFLAFMEGILLFFILNWWTLLILLIVAAVIFFIIRHQVKKAKKKAAVRNEEQQKRQEAYLAAKYGSAVNPGKTENANGEKPDAIKTPEKVKASVSEAHNADGKAVEKAEEKKADDKNEEQKK